MKLSIKLSLLTFTVGAILLVFMAVVSHVQQKDAVLEQSLAALQEMAHQRAEQIEVLLESESDVTNTLAHSPSLVEAVLESNRHFGELAPNVRSEEIDKLNSRWKSEDSDDTLFIKGYTENRIAQLLREHAERNPGVYGEIFVTNRYGSLVATTGKLTTLAHAHKYWWRAAYNKGKGKVFLDDRGFDISVGDYVIGVVVPIYVKNELVGIIKSNVKLIGPLRELIIDHNERHAGSMRIARSKGKIVVAEGVVPLSTSLGEGLSEAVSNRNAGTLYSQDSVNLFGYAPVEITLGGFDIGFGGKHESIDQIFGNLGEAWMVVIDLPFDEAIVPLNDQLRGTLLTGGILIVVLGLLAVLISRTIAHPISDLAEKATQIGSGNFNVHASTQGVTELSTLGKSFNTMVRQLQETTVSRDHLASEVKERKLTEELLKQSNDELSILLDKTKRQQELLSSIDDLRTNFIHESEPFKLFPKLLDHLIKLTDSEYGLIGEVQKDEENNRYLKIYALSNLSWSEETSRLYEKVKQTGFEFKNLDNLLGNAVTTGKTVISNEPSSDPRSKGFPEGHPALKSFLGLPVYFGEQLVGEIGLANKLGGYDEKLVDELVPVVAALGQIIATRWEKEARLKSESDIKAKNEDLSIALHQLAKAVEENEELKKREKENIYRATVTGTQHIINNLLNQLILVKLEIDKNPAFDTAVAEKFESMTNDARKLVHKLSSVENIEEEEIKDSIYPKNEP